MSVQEKLRGAGKNQLCNIAQACVASLIANLGHLSAEVKAFEDTTLLCFPKDVVEHFVFQKSAQQFDDANDLFTGARQKKSEQLSAQLQRFNESELDKLEKKYADTEDILKSPCIVFLVQGERCVDAYNFLPSEFLSINNANHT